MVKKTMGLVWLFVLGLLIACSESSTAPGPGPEPSEPGDPADPPVTSGSLEVAVSTNIGGIDEDGYTVLLDKNSRSRGVAVNGSVVFDDLKEGRYGIALEGLDNGCTVHGDNPLWVNVAAGQTAAAQFGVICGSLKDIAEENNILFGTLISYGNIWLNSDGVIQDGSPGGIYTELAKTEFNLGQATWGAAWDGWASKSTYNFAHVNTVINWSRAQGQTVMVHNILGPNNYMPDWFIEGSFTPDHMDDLLKDLIYAFMESNDNKSKVDTWDVMNEPLNTDGTYRDMKWNEMGWEDDASGLTGADKVNSKHPVFIGKALQYARDKTDALLEIRDYNIEIDHPEAKYYKKHKAFYQLIKHLQAKGYPLDSVGIQAHRNLGAEQAGGYFVFLNTIRKFKETGLNVYLTELDVGSKASWSNNLAKQQAEQYYDVVKTALEGGVNLISLWGIRDANDPHWRTEEHPLLFDENYNKKPAYYSVREALFEAN